MRTKIFYLLVIVCLSGCFGCRSNKDLVYLHDLHEQELQEGLPAPIPEYQIKTNDNLYISIQSLNPEVNRLFNPAQMYEFQSGTQQMYGQLSSQYLNGYHVDIKGNILLPVLGSIGVAGLTLTEAQGRIQEKADEYLKGATVKLKLLSYKVAVMGEVKKPGVYYNYNNSLTILEAISMANGITDYANINQVLVVRPTDNGSKSYHLDLSGKKLFTSDAFFLQPNDVVYIKSHKNKNTNLNAPVYTLFLSSLSTLVLILNFLED